MILRLNNIALVFVCVTGDGRGLGKVMFEVSTYLKGVSEPRIDMPSDSTREKAIKNIISKMLQLEPADRITAAKVVDRLSKLKGKR